MKIKCINDLEEERYGFLWLKKRKIKSDLYTVGKVYEVIDIHSLTYGSAFVNYTYRHYLIIADVGYKQLVPAENFIKWSE